MFGPKSDKLPVPLYTDLTKGLENRELYLRLYWGWSFNLKISCIWGGARFSLTLNISVARILTFLSWIETEPSFSKSELNDGRLSLHVILKHLSWRLLILLLFSQLWHIQISTQYLNCELKNAFIRVRFLDKLIPDVTLANVTTCFFVNLWYMIMKWQSTIKMYT